MRAALTSVLSLGLFLALPAWATPRDNAQYVARLAVEQGFDVFLQQAVRSLYADRLAAELQTQSVKVRDMERLAETLPAQFVETALGDPTARLVDIILRTQDPAQLADTVRHIKTHEPSLYSAKSALSGPVDLDEWLDRMATDVAQARDELQVVVPLFMFSIVANMALQKEIMTRPIDLGAPELAPIYQDATLYAFPNPIVRQAFFRGLAPDGAVSGLRSGVIVRRP